MVIDSDLQEKVLQVNRVNDRLMCIKLLIAEKTVNIISAYAPQQGCTEQEKLDFWEGKEELLQTFSQEEYNIIGADLNDLVMLGNTTLTSSKYMEVRVLERETPRETLYFILLICLTLSMRRHTL